VMAPPHATLSILIVAAEMLLAADCSLPLLAVSTQRLMPHVDPLHSHAGVDSTAHCSSIATCNSTDGLHTFGKKLGTGEEISSWMEWKHQEITPTLEWKHLDKVMKNLPRNLPRMIVNSAEWIDLLWPHSPKTVIVLKDTGHKWYRPEQRGLGLPAVVKPSLGPENRFPEDWEVVGGMLEYKGKTPYLANRSHFFGKHMYKLTLNLRSAAHQFNPVSGAPKSFSAADIVPVEVVFWQRN